MNIQKDISLVEHTTFKIGGRAEYFLLAKTKKDIIDGIEFTKRNNLPFFIIGAGSNVLAHDEGYRGLVIKIQNSKISALSGSASGGKIQADAGVKLQDLVNFCARNSLAGIEWMAGIPGTVGGAVYGNARAFEGKTEDNIQEVEALDARTGEIKIFKKSDCGFSEKQSVFKENKNLIVISAVFNLKKGNKKEIEKTIKEHLAQRKERHPLNYPSAGSVFVNRPGKEPSSMIIERAGLKGRRVGGAQVSEKHCGFIVNLGKATSKDVLDLIKIIKKEVKDKLNISLEEEIQIIK